MNSFYNIRVKSLSNPKPDLDLTKLTKACLNSPQRIQKNINKKSKPFSLPIYRYCSKPDILILISYSILSDLEQKLLKPEPSKTRVLESIVVLFQRIEFEN